MSETSYGQSRKESDIVNRAIRAVVVIVVALILAVVSVSFAVHHMRLKFEDEYKNITKTKMDSVSDIVIRTINGDDIANNPSESVSKYNQIFGLEMALLSDTSFSDENYALFQYSGGAVSLLSTSNDQLIYAVAEIDPSDWLSYDGECVVIEEDDYVSYIVPVNNSNGICVGVFEYKATFSELSRFGDAVESRVMKAVIISVFAGIIVFIVLTFLPKLIFKNKSGGQIL